MNLINDTWRGLVRRKLWPVALLLVAALVAVPLTLAKQPEVVPVAANAGASADDALPATFVTAATDTDLAEGTTTKRRRTLGAEKDPFEPAPLPKAKKKKTKKTTEKASTSTTATETTKDSGSTTSGGGGGGTTAPTAPVATATPTATPKPAPANSIRVRFSRVEEGSDEPKATLVEKLEVLPDDENPVIVFQGLEDKGKVAVFELTGTVTVEGDGECDPTPEACQFVRLRAGETVFVTVTDTGEATDAQYQLDLVKINHVKPRREPTMRKAGLGPPSLFVGSSACHCTSSLPANHTGRASPRSWRACPRAWSSRKPRSIATSPVASSATAGVGG